jgi:ElaB/YqjD/DUF883 family membrane-anchored ribosome-binding protein
MLRENAMVTTSTAARPDDTGTEGTDSQTAVQKLRDQADAVVQRIQPQIAAVSTYAREEPTKALLISAAAGAALMGLVALMVRSGSRSPADSATSAGQSAMAAIRDAALDLADSAQSMAADALATAQKRATDAFDATHKRATSAASSAAETVTDSVADAWKKVRDQAGPMVDKFKPQIDAAAAYAKEDPTRAALGLAAAGAIVAGLVALARHSQDDTMR